MSLEWTEQVPNEEVCVDALDPPTRETLLALMARAMIAVVRADEPSAESDDER